MTLSGAWPARDGFAFVSAESGMPQPWLQAWDGERRMLPVDGAVIRLAWRPDESRLLAVVDPTGGEGYQIVEIDPRTGDVEWILASPGVRYEVGVPYSSGSDPYSPDGRLLAYASTERDVECFDVYVHDLRTGQSRMVLRGDDRYLPMFFSPDSRRLLVLKLHQNTDHDLYACDLDTGEVTHLTPHEGPAKYQPGGWREDGIYVCTTEGRDHLGVARLVPGEPLEWLATPDEDIETVIVGPRILWPVGKTTWGAAVLPGIASLTFGYDGFVPRFAGEKILAQVGAADRANELYLADPSTGEIQKLTDHSAALPDDLVAPETVRFEGGDGLEITALLYRPRGSATCPAVLHIHGGPEAEAVPIFDPLIQHLVRAGMAVLAPNVRGSSGHGMRFQRLIYRDWGGGDVRDFEACARYLQSLDWVDGLGVMGASYGGFATMACLSRLPGYWRAGVSIAGSADLEHDVRTYPPTWRRRTKDWVGDLDDPAERARLAEASPLTHAANIQAPLLLAHGVNDTRVAIDGTMSIYNTLTELGRTVELIRMDGGHMAHDGEEWDNLETAVVAWLRRYLIENR